MRIVIFNDSYIPGVDGVTIAIRNITRILKKEGHEFLVVCPKYSSKDPKDPNAKILRLPSVNLLGFEEYKFALPIFSLEEISKFKPDCIHVCGYGPVSFAGVYAAKRLKLPLLGTFHTLVSEMGIYLSPKKYTSLKEKESVFKKTVWKASIKLYEQCDMVTTPTPTIARELTKRKFKKKVLAISNGVDIQKFPAKKTYNKNPKKIVYVGRLGFEKRVDMVITAFAQIQSAFPNVILELYGEGSAQKGLEKLVKKYKLQKNVLFKGFIPNDKLYKVYQQADIFITASPMETQGLVLIEAMSCGTPCIGIDKFAIKDAISHGKNGYVAKKPYQENLTKYLQKLLEKPKDIEQFGKAAHKAMQKHEIHKCMLELEKAYKKVIKM